MKGEEEEEEEEVQLREQMGLSAKVLALPKWDEREQEEKPETLLTRAIDTEKGENLYNLTQKWKWEDYICEG